MNKLIKKEYGSFYHAVDIYTTDKEWCDSAPPVFMGSGRDALYAVLFDIRNKSKYEIKRIWLPSYYCHSVTHVLERSFDICIYEARPGIEAVISEKLSERDLLVVLEYFGHKANLKFFGDPCVVLDKTHNPVSTFNYYFNVDFVFGSLRKILPLADGGFYFSSNIRHEATAQWPVTDKHVFSYVLINKAMRLKLMYLKTGEISKEEFLRIHAEGESQVGEDFTPSGMISGNDLVQYADMHYYLSKRIENNNFLKCMIEQYDLYFNILDSYIFFIILFSSENHRNFFKFKLIAKNIYPAILWPIDDKYMLSDDTDLSRRTLVLPTDFRYGKSDMEYIANTLKNISETGDACQL